MTANYEGMLSRLGVRRSFPGRYHFHYILEEEEAFPRWMDVGWGLRTEKIPCKGNTICERCVEERKETDVRKKREGEPWWLGYKGAEG